MTNPVSRLRVTDAEQQVRYARRMVAEGRMPAAEAAECVRRAFADLGVALAACPDHTAPVSL